MDDVATTAKRQRGLVTVALLVFALVAFAGNSLLNRAALDGQEIDWISFTAIRIVSAAAFLALLLGFRHRKAILPERANILPAVVLVLYAASFSFAYISLDAALGAVILFSVSQISLQIIAMTRGVFPTLLQWLGLALALAGLIIFLAPGISAPPLLGGLMMALSGVAWGTYSWFGKSATKPALETTRNFVGAAVLCVPVIPILILFSAGELKLEATGVGLAIAAGMITSGLGYIIWYTVLPGLSVSTAAASQLAVPAIAAVGGVLLLDEVLTMRFYIGSALILAGVALTVVRSR